MKKSLLISCLLVFSVTLISCHKEPGEFANHLYIENNSGQDISLRFCASGMWKNFYEKNGERKQICQIEFFGSGSLRTLLGDTVDVVMGDETHCIFTCSNGDGEVLYSPSDNNILNIGSWKEERIDEINNTYTYVFEGIR